MLPKKMKAAVVRKFGTPLVIEDRPVPRPGRGQVLVKVVASGVCHTDLHAADGDWPAKPKPPFVPGHEAAGFVVALGEGVTFLAEGDRVGVPWLHSACGRCDYCVTGWETLCPDQECSGYTVDGGFAEYVLAEANYVGRIPDGLDLSLAAPILCAGVTTYKGLKETGAKAGDLVAIVGIGGLGHVAVQYARAMGLRVIAVDVSDDKLRLAKSLGAEHAIDATKTDPATEVQERFEGVNAALVTAVSTASFRQAIDMLRRGGTCSLVGLPPGDFETPIFDVVLKGLTIRGSIVGNRTDLSESLRFAAEGQVRPTVEMRKLEEINDIFERLKSGDVHGRVVLDLTS